MTYYYFWVIIFPRDEIRITLYAISFLESPSLTWSGLLLYLFIFLIDVFMLFSRKFNSRDFRTSITVETNSDRTRRKPATTRNLLENRRPDRKPAWAGFELGLYATLMGQPIRPCLAQRHQVRLSLILWQTRTEIELCTKWASFNINKHIDKQANTWTLDSFMYSVPVQAVLSVK